MKKILLIFFGIIFFAFTINSIDAVLCKGYDGYYHDCGYNFYQEHYYKQNFIYLNKYPHINYHKINYYNDLDYYIKPRPKIYIIKDERNYELNYINTDKKFNIYLDNPPIIKIKNYKIKSAKNCPEGFICFKQDYLR